MIKRKYEAMRNWIRNKRIRIPGPDGSILIHEIMFNRRMEKILYIMAAMAAMTDLYITFFAEHGATRLDEVCAGSCLVLLLVHGKVEERLLREKESVNVTE